jgi:oligopeptidase B
MRILAYLVFVFAMIAGNLMYSKGASLMFTPAPKVPHKHEIHGDIRIDDYFWMRERDSEPVLKFLAQENQRAKEALAPVADLEKKLYSEMRARIKEDDASVPQLVSGYYYYTRYQTGQEYPIHCRRKGSMDAPEQIILDENELAKGHEYFEVAAVDVSPDQRYLAFAVDLVGRRIYEIRFRDLETGATLPDRVESATPSMAWAKDNKTLFFVRQDLETLRAHQLWRFELGVAAPLLIFEEKDTTYNVGVSSTKTHNFIFMDIQKRDSSEWRVLDAANPRGEFRIFLPRELKHEYHLDDGGDRFFVLTNWKAKNFRLMEAPLHARSKDEWKEVVPHDPAILREEIEVYESHVVLSERQQGLGQIRVRNRSQGTERLLNFDDPTYELTLRGLEEYRSTDLRFAYESFVQPPSIYDEDLASGKRVLKKERIVPGYDRSKYESKRIWAKATDGTLVPVSLVYLKGLKLDGSNPVLLYGYGSYGLSNSVNFFSAAFSLCDRGFVYAQAHIRGGSEMGREWYESGRLKFKMNTFTDFIASAEKLIADGYTSPQHLHIMGGSAGGLLVGAVMNMRPELFKSVSAGVPFVDVLTTMLDETIPLTTGEYNEWGDPRKKDEYMYMRQYSPYDNIQKRDYPHLFVTTGYHDSQVQYWEPAKWVAKLRDYKTDQNLLLMYTEFEAGHSGASGRFEALKLLAKEFAFILMVEGIKE